MLCFTALERKIENVKSLVRELLQQAKIVTPSQYKALTSIHFNYHCTSQITSSSKLALAYKRCLQNKPELFTALTVFNFALKKDKAHMAHG